MTDVAHRYVDGRKLREMTIDAGFMAGQTGLRLSAVARMTGLTTRRVGEVGMSARTRVRKC